MPAEWALHSATWLAWPSNEVTYPKKILRKVEESFCEMVAAITSGEIAKILIGNEKQEAYAEKMLLKAGVGMQKVSFQNIPSIDVWIRDYGPTFLSNKKKKSLAALKWTFNAWGNKWPDLLPDDLAGKKVAEKTCPIIYRPKMILEGGSIDVNGAGLLLTTEQCLLNKNRNPHLARMQIENALKANLSVNRIIWLKKGIEGDDTDGHIDDIARFVSQNSIVCASSRRKDKDAEVLKENIRILAMESGLEICKIPMPEPIYADTERRRLPASYANFYISNKAVLVPEFGCKEDREATEILATFFPKREIVPIRSNELVYGYGGIHCMTQQEPHA